MRAFWKKGKRAFALGVALFSVLFGCVAAFAIAMDVGFAASSGAVGGLSDSDNIVLTYSGDKADTWFASGQTITGSVQSSSGACGSTTNYSSTLTITNKKGKPATLSFDYTVDLQGGTIQVDGTGVIANGSFSKEVDSQGTVSIYLESNSTSSPTKITISNIILIVNITATATFLPPSNGWYTVDGTKIDEVSESFVNSQPSSIAYSLEAHANDGYTFASWEVAYKDGLAVSYLEAKITFNCDQDCSIKPLFVSDSLAQFKAAGKTFVDFDKAVKYAQEQNEEKVVLFRSGILGGEHAIPKGVTFLVPFDSGETLYKEEPKVSSGDDSNFAAYLTLTMSSDCSLNVKGAISIGGVCKAAGGSEPAKMIGKYGLIQLEENSSIIVENGGFLYAWGFVSGPGAVHVKAGGHVYEWMQILDFRGGSATSSMKKDSKVFPFNQYAVQNVESAMTIDAGGKETAFASIYALRRITYFDVPFVGGESSNAMFRLSGGSITKQYDYATGRCLYSLDGNSSLSPISIRVGIDIKSKDYVFPITNNMSIRLKSGTLTINQSVALLAGVECFLDSGAEMILSSGVDMYVYDEDQWKGKKYSCTGNDSPVVQRLPGKKGAATPAAVKDAEVDINGVLTVQGNLYTTSSGAKIRSSLRSGVIKQVSAPGSGTETFQYTQSDKKLTECQVPVTAAKLLNQDADSTFFETASVSSGQTIRMKSISGGYWVWEAKDSTSPLVLTYHVGELSYSRAFNVDVDQITILNSSEIPNNTDPRKALAWSISETFSDDTFYSPGATYSRKAFLGDCDLYPVYEGWVNGHFYFDAKIGGPVKGLFYTNRPGTEEMDTLWFDLDAGRFDLGVNEVVKFAGEYYLIESGARSIPDEGWYRVANTSGSYEIRYYYFTQNGYSYRDTKSPVYIDHPCKSGDQIYLPAGWYTFGADGYVQKADNYVYNSADPNPLYIKEKSGTVFCFCEGVKAGIGLFECDGYVYYAQKDASIFKNGTLYVADMHGITDGDKNPLTPGLYYFDDQGRMFDSSFALIDKTSSNA